MNTDCVFPNELAADDGDHFWVFGYGSLMWNPGFDYVESHHAKINGLHRSPCIFSWEHRGTRERPGIVLGLDRGGACLGMGFKVAIKQAGEVITYLRARELITNVYVETIRSMTLLPMGEKVPALTYVADRNHEQYGGKLSHEELIRHIKGARGASGPNEAYFLDTARQLDRMGIRDRLMENLARELQNQN